MALSDEERVVLAWSESTQSDEKVFLTTFTEGGWNTPVQLGENKIFSFHPTAGINKEGDLWAVWSSADRGETELYYSVKKNGRWSSPKLYDTGLSNNKSASLLFDRYGRPIIVWTAIEEMYSDIYWAIYENGNWSIPKRVHPANNVPDVEPRLYSDSEGTITLQWKTVRDKKYVLDTAVYGNGDWMVGDLSQTPAARDTSSKAVVGEIPPLPVFIEDPRKASIFINNSGGSMNIPASAE